MKAVADGIVLAFWGLIVILGIWGYALNVIAIWNSHVVDGVLILRVLGIFVPPVGTILGWLS